MPSVVSSFKRCPKQSKCPLIHFLDMPRPRQPCGFNVRASWRFFVHSRRLGNDPSSVDVGIGIVFVVAFHADILPDHRVGLDRI